MALKASTKRDPKTKDKALASLLNRMESCDLYVIDDNVQWAWIQLYPKLSIDADSLIRSRAHQIQQVFFSRLKKTASKFLKLIMGPWLAGTFDTDRGVALAASTSVETVFPDEEKRKQLWILFAPQLIEYCKDVVENEEVSTLSDLRYTSKDEATAKYGRAVSSAIKLAKTAVRDSTTDGRLSSELKSYVEQLIEVTKFWQLASSTDPIISQATLQFVIVISRIDPDLLKPFEQQVSKQVWSRGLKHCHDSCRLELAQTLIQLSSVFPNMWNSSKVLEKQYLEQFLTKGSRKSGKLFWSSITPLIKTLPPNYCPLSSEHTNIDHQVSVISAIGKGVVAELTAQVQVPQTPTVVAAWTTYLSLIGACSTPIIDKTTFLDEIYDAFLNNNNRRVETIVRESAFLEPVATKIAQIINKAQPNSHLEQQLENQLTQLTSRSGDKSVTVYFTLIRHVFGAVDASSCHWLAHIFTRQLETSLSSHTTDSLALAKLIVDTIPFNTIPSEVIENFMKTGSSLFGGSTSTALAVLKFTTSLASRLEEPSVYKPLFQDFFARAFDNSTDANFAVLLECAPQVSELVTPIAVVGKRLEANSGLFASPESLECLTAAICAHDVFVSRETSIKLFDALYSKLDSAFGDTEDVANLTGCIRYICDHDRTFFEEYCTTTEKGKLLMVEIWDKGGKGDESFEEILKSLKISGPQSSEHTSTRNEQLKASVLESLEDDLKSGNLDDLENLVDRGQRLIDESRGTDGQKNTFEELVLNLVPWSHLLQRIFDSQVDVVAAIYRKYGSGAVYLLDQGSMYNSLSPQGVCCYGLFTMALYINNAAIAAQLPLDLQATLITNLCIVCDYASITSLSLNIGNVDHHERQVLHEAARALDHDVQFLIKDASPSNLFNWLVESDEFKDSYSETGTKEFYYALASSRILSLPGNEINCNDLATKLRSKLRSGSSFGALSLYCRATEPHTDFNWLANYYASEMAGFKVGDSDDKMMSHLVNLNIVLQSSSSDMPLPPNRLAMVMSSLASWSSSSDKAYTVEFSPALTELLRFFNQVLPLDAKANGIQTNFWDTSFDVLEQAQEVVLESVGEEMSQPAPLLCCFLEFFNTCNSTIKDDSEWDDRSREISKAILELIAYQFFEVWNNADIGKQILHFSNTAPKLDSGPSTGDFCSVLGLTHSTWIQRAAFNISRCRIKEEQKQALVEFHLGNKSSDLPPELVGVIVDAPQSANILHSSGAVDDVAYELSSPEVLRCTAYLLAWELILLHFEDATYELRALYINQLKEQGHVGHLLDFLATMDFHEVSGDTENTNEELAVGQIGVGNTDLGRVALHVLYGILQYTGSSARSWYANVKRKRNAQAIQRIAETVITPRLVSAEMARVEERETTSSDAEFYVKFYRNQKEIRVYYTKDDQTMELNVRFPADYPLRDLEIEGVRRIGVREKQWRAWILASQAIASSAGGTACDAIELLKRNISLHFEGTEECAICYSILHEDHSLPNKTCGTCHKKFHTDCIYKWFKSAGSQSCPLCRTTLSFRAGLK